MEGPYPVQKIITDYGAQKAGAVGDVLIQPDFLPAYPGNTKVHENAGKPDDSEFQKFPKQVIVHGSIVLRLSSTLGHFVITSLGCFVIGSLRHWVITSLVIRW